MSDITNEEFENLEKLARIRCSEDEKENLLTSLDKILDYMEQMQKIPTDDVSICSHPTTNPPQTPLREDLPEDIFDRNIFLKNAPETIGGMIRTPPVITEEP